MARTKRENFTVTPTGVGRKDYSEEVQFSVEPTVRSYQDAYYYDNSYSLSAGQTRTIDIAVASDRVVLLYDYLLSVPANALISMEVQSIDSLDNSASVFRKSDYQKIEAHHNKGAPFFKTIRIIMQNLSSLNLTALLSLAGIHTSEEEYHQSITQVGSVVTVVT